MTLCKGLIFDIERFAVHDGKGIRTTVFLKGCPLACRWCQNPEGIDPRRKLVWKKSRCIRCRQCSGLEGFGWDEKEDRPVFDGCTPWMEKACELCPSGALAPDSSQWSPEDLLRELLKDREFFNLEGGVTFSGGEPLMQKDFLLEMIPLCKKAGIHTAIETSLCADLKIVQAVLPLLDEIYFDIKAFQPDLHMQLTGRTNEHILENAAWVLQAGLKADITVRTPLIPGCTAELKNIEEIAGFLAGTGKDPVYELLNCNPLAPAKYPLAGRVFSLKQKMKRYTAQEMKEFADAARESGLSHVKTGS